MGPPSTANGRVRAKKVGYDLSTKWAISVFFGQIVPFLVLWDDVIEGSPHPKLNGYQRPIPGGACGAKGLGKYVQTPVRYKRWHSSPHSLLRI